MSRYTGYNQRGFANSTVAITRAASGTSTPIDFANTALTTLYLPFNDDVNDDSPLSQTITNRGSITIDSTYKKFGSNALKSQTNGSLKIDNSASTDFDGDGFFTIEFFLYVVTHAENKAVYTHNEFNDSYSGLLFWFGGAETLRAYGSTNGSSWNLLNGSSFGTISTDTWHHVALTYDGIQYRGYLDGVGKFGVSSSTTVSTGGDHYIFSRNDGGQYQPATGAQYIDDFRITKGKALYTASTYTVPTSALGIEQTDPVSLYLPFDSDVNDDSSYGHTVTASGAAISSTQSKFGGNSLALDGSNDKLEIPANDAFTLGTSDFTMEGWMYCTAYGELISCFNQSNPYTGFTLSTAFINGGKLELFASDGSGNQTMTSTNTYPQNEWVHFACTRAGNTVSFWKNGELNGTATITETDIGDSQNVLRIGASNNGTGNRFFGGYLDDIRITKGAARYMKNFIPPSAAVGATLNGTNETNTTTDFTSLYLPLDSDVNDDSDNPFTITASGNAAISSTQAKFGGYSLALDGSGDYLTVGSSQSAMAFAGDFTIEFWMYPTSLSGSYVGPMGCHDSTGWLFQFASGGGRFYINGSNEITTTATTSTNQWYHVAVTRNSGTVKLFIDGVEQGSLSFSSAMPTNNDLIIGGSNASGQYFPGYLDDIRILNGYAKYTSKFTPPTSAVGTSVSQTVNDLTVLYLPFDADVSTSSGGLTWDTSTNTSYYTYDDEYQVKRGGTISWGFVAISSATFSSGKYSVDFKVNSATSGTKRTNIGIIKSGQESGGGSDWLSEPFGGSTASSAGVQDEDYSTNDYFTLNVDFDSGTLEVLQNNSSVGTDTFTTGGNWHIAFQEYDNTSEFEIQDQIYAAPSGYTKLTRSTGVTTETLTGGFADQARNNGVTTGGTAAINSSVKKFGTGSLFLDGNSDYAAIPADSFSFDTQDFTVEAWVYHTGVSGSSNIFDFRKSGDGFTINMDTSGNVGYYSNKAGDYVIAQGSNSIGTNSWKHLALCRHQGTTRLFIDGVLKASASDSYDYGSLGLTIGARYDQIQQWWAGYIDDFRVIQGKAIYTAAFTPPTSAHGHNSLAITSSNTETYSDTKFLSGVWDITDVRDKMMQSTWVSNDSRLPNGAGLEDSNHRWYSAPNSIDSVEILAVGAGGDGGNNNRSGGNTVFTHSGTNAYILAVGGGGSAPAGGGVGRAGGGGGGFVSATDLTLDRDVSYTLTVGASGAVVQSPVSNPAPSWPGGSGGGGTYVGGGVGRAGGTGVQPSTPQPLISGIPGASNFQNLGYDGGSHPPNSDNPGSDNGPGRGGGGLGTASSITGSSQTYAGGGYSGNRGGNETYLSNPGPGGSSNRDSGNGGPGTRGGGGGGAGASSNSGGSGGPGVFVIAYPDSDNALTISGSLSYSQPSRSGYRVYYFTSGTGTITLPS